MIDSVLKGSGNSRFLKSAVPAGTSWADALAMLQAGTFPIDFNGINTEGFQQVGTPLNKANLLKDATAAQIGLPPSTTPDGMFQALGNTGELHVWRKTVKNAADVPAGYNLGTKTTKTILNTNDNSHGSSAIYYSSSVSVSDSGTVSLKNPTTTGVDIYTSSLPIVGKFFYIDLSSVQTSDLIQKKIYFVPSGTTISVDDSPKAFSGIVQEVTGYAKIPAGTTTTYPVSTNPNAYQEGDDAKAAGYVLGDVKTGSFQMAEGYPSNNVFYETANSINVGADGAITLNSPTVASFTSSGFPDDASFLGKFIRFSHRGASGSTTPPATTPPFNTTPSEVVYIPASATITHTNGIHAVDRYQPVTGYAAIPASTTIEYLGKLGDKAMVQVLSYVGTGTYGSSNPNSLTFDFVPKLVIIRCNGNSSNKFDWIIGMTDVEVHWDGDYHCFVSIAGKTLSFYSFNNSYYQMNESGKKYYAIAIG